MRTMICLLATLLASITFATEVSVSDAIVRGMPPGQKVTAAFLTVVNGGAHNCDMIGVYTNVSEKAEMHTHSHENGMMRMRQVETVSIPAGETLVFKSGSLHIMMFGLQRDLQDGELVAMVLNFNNCEDVRVDAVVRSINTHH